jgi:formylmethanofuran dehydrogenase subunit E-like metal-binding protein
VSQNTVPWQWEIIKYSWGRKTNKAKNKTAPTLCSKRQQSYTCITQVTATDQCLVLAFTVTERLVISTFIMLLAHTNDYITHGNIHITNERHLEQVEQNQSNYVELAASFKVCIYIYIYLLISPVCHLSSPRQ